MAEAITPTGMMMSGDGGVFGGGGLIGGLILGSLLRNNGNLFGGDGAAAASNLNMGTYDTLINCREDLKNQLYELFNLIGTRPDSIPGGLVD